MSKEKESCRIIQIKEINDVINLTNQVKTAIIPFRVVN